MPEQPCIRCGELTPNAWPHGEGGLCNGSPLEPGTSEYAEVLAACQARRAEQDAEVVAKHSTALFERAADVYNGVPLALVELWPVPGEPLVGPHGVAWVVASVSGGEIHLKRVVDVSKRHVEYAHIRPTCTCDGLYWSDGNGERDGYALLLASGPGQPPGDRQWSIRGLDRLRPQVLVTRYVTVTTPSVITVQGVSS